MDNRLFKQLPQSHNLFCTALFGKRAKQKGSSAKDVWRDTCPYKALSKALTFGKPTLLGTTAQFSQIN